MAVFRAIRFDFNRLRDGNLCRYVFLSADRSRELGRINAPDKRELDFNRRKRHSSVFSKSLMPRRYHSTRAISDMLSQNDIMNRECSRWQR